jgi:hypothetical protein
MERKLITQNHNPPPNLAVQATAAAHCNLHALDGSLVLRFILAQSPAAVPDLARWTN